MSTDTAAPVVPDPEATTDTEATDTAEKKSTGRPRPENTQKRDAAALEVFKAKGYEGVTRDTLAEELTKSLSEDVKSSEAYLSIYRLSRQDPPAIVKRRDAGKTVWYDATAPVPEKPAETEATETTEVPATPAE